MQKLEIKQTIIKEWELFFTIAAIIIVVYKLTNPDFLIIIPSVFLLYIAYSIIKRLQNRQPGIIIDTYGIYLASEDKSLSWKIINDVEVEEMGGDKMFLKIKTQQADFVIDLSPFETTSYKVEKAIMFFSNGNIKGKKTKFSHSIDKLINDEKNSQIIIDKFKTHKRKVLWVGSLIFFGGLAASVFFQISYPFPYSFAMGWSITLISLFLYYKQTELRLRHFENIKELTDSQFNAIAIKFGLRNNTDKKNQIFVVMFMVFVSIGIFVVSYLVTI